MLSGAVTPILLVVSGRIANAVLSSGVLHHLFRDWKAAAERERGGSQPADT